MRFVPVDSIPKNGRINESPNAGHNIIERFLKKNIICEKIPFDNSIYSSMASASSSMKKTARRFGYPVYVSIIKKELYIERFDM
jgi:hypothetical protein